ncbi:hypothetical protein M0R89_16395 [Halorussus limi]|uniref:DUF4013 domain-containing protein n=1 Tax=Halorussus limi TaxID=2938695 RepID=A0A8U0HTS5_9EURY|nr:hypothetical protein [Halorussus limi]UPV74106.1 hypothetical protein M0R89_16395 [Halorussus limi]
MPSTDASRTPPDGKSFGTRLEIGWERATDHLPLAAVPLLSSLLAVDNVRRVRSAEGVNIGVSLPFPAALPDLWTFVNVPSPGPGVHFSPTIALLPVQILLQAALVAGLVGSVAEVLRTGRYDFAANARRYFAPMLGFVALVRAVTLALAGPVVAAPLLIVFLIPAFLVLKYLFYATTYLVAVNDDSLADALTRSYRLATAGGPYLSYGAGYLLFAAAVSLVTSAFVVNLGLLGVAVGAVATAPVALALTFATTEFVADLDANERGDGEVDGRGGGFGGAEGFGAGSEGFDGDTAGPGGEFGADRDDREGPTTADDVGETADEPRDDYWDRRKDGGER